MKVLFLTNIPSPYRADFFNELGKLCDLTVTYEGFTSTERDSKWVGSCARYYKPVFMKGKRTQTDKFFCLEIISILKQKWDAIIVGNYSTPTSMLAIEYMKLHKISYIIQADGGLISQGENKFKYLLKKNFIGSAKIWMSSGDATSKYLVHYGAKQNLCFKYPFTSLWKEDLIEAEKLRNTDRLILRNKLGMKEKHIVISVGRFSYDAGYGKGYDLLMKAAEKLTDDIGIYIIGDEPTEEFIEWKKNKKLEHVHFIGFKVKKDLLEYYAAADLFVLMTRSDVWGLVINEAMMFGLPVITTDMCVAGLELVENDKNGYVIPISETNKLHEKIKYIVDNEQIKDEFGKESLQRVQSYTLENMAAVNLKIINNYVNKEK